MPLGSAQYVCTTYQIFDVNSTEILLTITCLMLESNRILALIWLPISDSQRGTSVIVFQIMRIQLLYLENTYFSQTHYQNTFCIIYQKLPFLNFNYTTPNHFSSLVFDNCKQRSKYKNKKYMSTTVMHFPFLSVDSTGFVKKGISFQFSEWPHS